MKKMALICLSALLVTTVFIATGYDNDNVIASNDDESTEYEYEYYYTNNNDIPTDDDAPDIYDTTQIDINSINNDTVNNDKSDNNINENDTTKSEKNRSDISKSDTDKPETSKSGNGSSDGLTVHPVDTTPDSLSVFVNKDYALPSDYIPENLVKPDVNYYGGDSERRLLRKEAAKALEKMFNSAKKDVIYLYGVSGYRSYGRQKTLYATYINQRGKVSTNKVSAKPGHSEHQTGLCIDISISRLGGALTEEFGSTDAGKWVAKNCHKYGFIVRYPKDKESVTGYSYEPWHIRYVGKDIAKYIYKHKITLEEYYGCSMENNDLSEITSDTVDE